MMGKWVMRYSIPVLFGLVGLIFHSTFFSLLVFPLVAINLYVDSKAQR